MHGSHLVKSHSRTQSNIALSAWEAEFFALVATASEALGLVAMTEDFGDKTESYLYADASAAIGVANREGVGRIRHIDTQSLWLPQALWKRRLGLGKVLGTENPSDLMTKHVDSKLLGDHVRCMGCEFVAGRAELAPQIVQEVEDVVEFVEDSPSVLMTASASEQSTTHKIHCAIDSEVCLPPVALVHRVTRRSCRGSDEAEGKVLNRQMGSNCIDRGYSRRVPTNERLRGHQYVSFALPVGRSRSRGVACLIAVCPCRLSLFTNEHLEHLCTCDVHLFFSLDAFWIQVR